MSKPLTAAQLQELKTLLEQRKAEIEARLHDVRDGQTRAEHAREIIQTRGSVERQHSSDREVDLALSDMGEVELTRVEAALARIEAGVYGLCDECGCHIPFERLKLEPPTQHCVACKSRWERQAGVVPDSNM